MRHCEKYYRWVLPDYDSFDGQYLEHQAVKDEFNLEAIFILNLCSLMTKMDWVKSLWWAIKRGKENCN